MENGKVKSVIGFVTYGKSTFKYLPYFLPSLTADLRVNIHDYTGDIKILAFDNREEDNKNAEYIKKNFPEIEVMGEGKNFGFAKSFNKMMRKAKEDGAEYFLALNPDMILEKGATAKMVEALDKDQSLGSVCPKILKWDFVNNKKTDIIDSCGICQLSALNFYDLGQSEKDIGQCEGREIIGPSAAAAMYRMSALEKIKEGDNYFDELMFMYKEDCDLAYRLHLAGFKSKCVSDAIIYHSRSASAKGESDIEVALNRKNKNKDVKEWSFLNQQIIFLKYWRLQSFLNKVSIIWYELKMLVFILLFEQYLLKEYLNLWRIRKKIKVYK